MIRFLTFLFHREYEPCKSCQTLKEQLAYERDNNHRLTQVLLDIVKPKVVEAAPIEMNQIAQSSAIFSRRRAALEEKDRQEAKILRERKHLGVPDKPDDSIAKLEQELGVSETEGEAINNG